MRILVTQAGYDVMSAKLEDLSAFSSGSFANMAQELIDLHMQLGSSKKAKAKKLKPSREDKKRDAVLAHLTRWLDIAKPGDVLLLDRSPGRDPGSDDNSCDLSFTCLGEVSRLQVRQTTQYETTLLPGLAEVTSEDEEPEADEPEEEEE